MQAYRTAYWRRSCLPTLPARPTGPRNSAIPVGTSCSTPSTALCAASWSVSAARARHGWRRLLRRLRRAGQGDSLCRSHRPWRARAWTGTAHRPAHRRVRGHGQQAWWHRRAHRRSSRRPGHSGGGTRVEYGQGSRGRLWNRIPEPWRPCAKRRPGPVAAVCRGCDELSTGHRAEATETGRPARAMDGVVPDRISNSAVLSYES